METNDIRTLIGNNAFFRGLGAEAIDFIAGCASNARFSQDEYLFHEGGSADDLYVVRAGHVALELQAPEKGALVIDTIGEGDIAGVSWLFPPYRWEFDARATEVTRALKLDAACLRAKCDEDPRLGFELAKRLAGVMRVRLRSARIRLLDLYGHARVG